METINGFLTWDSLKTFAGCVATVGIIVQFTKGSLDKYLKIPTKLYTYIISLLILLVTDVLFGPRTVDNFVLDLLDAIIVSLSANGAYHLFSEGLSSNK